MRFRGLVSASWLIDWTRPSFEMYNDTSDSPRHVIDVNSVTGDMHTPYQLTKKPSSPAAFVKRAASFMAIPWKKAGPPPATATHREFDSARLKPFKPCLKSNEFVPSSRNSNPCDLTVSFCQRKTIIKIGDFKSDFELFYHICLCL